MPAQSPVEPVTRFGVPGTVVQALRLAVPAPSREFVLVESRGWSLAPGVDPAGLGWL